MSLLKYVYFISDGVPHFKIWDIERLFLAKINIFDLIDEFSWESDVL